MLAQYIGCDRIQLGSGDAGADRFSHCSQSQGIDSPRLTH